MKKIIYIALAAVLAAVSCAKTTEFDSVKPDRSGEGLTIRFTTGDLATRAVEGVDKENMIKKIDYFIFPLNLDTDGKMIGTTEYVYKGTVTPEDDGLAGSYEETFTPGVLNEIFPDGATKAMVFAVANYVDKFGAAVENPNTTIPESATTWADLHALEVGETFFKDGGPSFGLRWPRVMQPSPYEVPVVNEGEGEGEGEGDAPQTETVTDDLFFVMTGEQTINLEVTNGYVVEAEIPLKRLASKVTVDFTYETVIEEKTSGNIYWIPQPSGEETRVFLSNAIEHTTLGGPLTRTLVADDWGTATKPSPGGDGTRDLFEYAYDFMNDITATDDGQVIAHYYTYPISMEKGDDNQPYIKLVLPWYGYKWVGDGNAPEIVDPSASGWQMYKQKEVYYKIVLPRETICDPNYIYEFHVNVNIIGSDKEIKIIGEEYKVKDWLTKDPVSSNVATGRYISLDIPKDKYDMYVNEIDIAFVSSGKVVPIIEEIYQLNYSAATGVTRDYFMQNNAVKASNTLKTNKRISDDDIKGWVTIPENTSYLKINHEMDNRMTINNAKNTAFDMAPYVYKVRLHLADAGTDKSFDRTITITQYPSLYVTSRLSNGYVFVNGAGYGYTPYDDGSTNNRTRLGNISTSPGSLDGSEDSNDNPNNYIITTTLISGSDYILGDPRSSEVNNLSRLSLTNYRPTSEEGTENTIAPKFIVASSYGRIGGSYYFDLPTAQKRCAAYQENGYPAGRWRVPTFAEIEFMVTLSRMEFIPSLYNFSRNDYTGYWSANGKVIGNESGLPELNTAYNDRNTAVRCVYDAWYWGEEPYQENATTWLGYKD